MSSKEFDDLLNEYYEKFKEPYPLVITQMGDVSEDIKNCIKTGKPAKEPEYEEGADY